MTIATGTKLGRYEIRSKIGEGGMGEVYLAEDIQLHRRVALKMLRADIAANQDRMRRFVQEAQATAALNHPNIAHIYEIGESGGVHFIAMEFIDGQTLRESIHKAPTDLKKLLRYLQHSAEGLAKAHAAGIVRGCLAQAASEIPLNICDIPIIPSGRAASAAGRRVGPGCTAIV